MEHKIELMNQTALTRQHVEMVVETANRFSSNVLFVKDKDVINGKSMLGLMTLFLNAGNKVTLTVEGEDEAEAMKSMLRQLESIGVIAAD